MNQDVEEKKFETPELEDEELDEVSGGTGARELGGKGIQPGGATVNQSGGCG